MECKSFGVRWQRRVPEEATPLCYVPTTSLRGGGTTRREPPPYQSKCCRSRWSLPMGNTSAPLRVATSVSLLQSGAASYRRCPRTPKFINHESVLENMMKADPEIEKAWHDESVRRWERYKRGESKTVSYDKVMSKYRKPG